VKHIESLDSVLACIGAVEGCGLSDGQDVQADSSVGLLEEIEPQEEVVYRGSWDPATISCRRVGVYFEMADTPEEMAGSWNDDGDVIQTADRVTELVASFCGCLTTILRTCLSGETEEVDVCRESILRSF
jgi:hypothetical protein